MSGSFRFLTAILGIVLVMAATALPAAASTTIKVALVTPNGSTWTQTLEEMASAVEKATDGQVRFRIYAGAVSGDEMDVLRKMRVGIINAAGFSGVGLGVVLPEVRILEAPLLFRSYAEVDYVKDHLFDRFRTAFEKKGFELLGFAEAGFVYFFSKRDLSEPNAFDEMKMWVWQGDPVAQTFLDTFGIRTFPLHIADVTTGLETNMIDSFYSPPLAAVAFQWDSQVKTMLDFPMVNSTGALLMNKSVFDKLSPQQQQQLTTIARRYSKLLVARTRKENVEARKVLAESGITFVSPTAAQIARFRKSAERTYQEEIPAIYPRALFDRVEALLAEYRRKAPAAAPVVTPAAARP